MSIPNLWRVKCEGLSQHSSARTVDLHTFKAFRHIRSTASPPPGSPIQHLQLYLSTKQTMMQTCTTYPIPTAGIFLPLLRVKLGIIVEVMPLSKVRLSQSYFTGIQIDATLYCSWCWRLAVFVGYSSDYVLSRMDDAFTFGNNSPREDHKTLWRLSD